MSYTEAAHFISRAATENGNRVASFHIVIKQGDVHEVARFPFMGTLQQAENEAERLASCFTNEKVIAIVAAWWEE